MNRFLLILSFVLSHFVTKAQIRIQDPTKIVRQRVEQRVNSSVNKGVNQGMKKAEDKATGRDKKKTDRPPSRESQPQPADETTASTRTTPGNVPGREAAGVEAPNNPPRPTPENRPASASSARPYAQFDFVPAATVQYAEDFKQTAIGDFPKGWNSSSTGEVVTIRNVPGQWLAIGKQGQFMPEAITELPNEFTLQFNLACSNRINEYSSGIAIAFADQKKPAKEFTEWTYDRKEGGRGVAFTLHPMAASGQAGYSDLTVLAGRQPVLSNRVSVQSFWAKGRNLVRVSVWRQQERLRVYINDEKIWDLPHAFQSKADYNSVVFALGKTYQEGDLYYLSNLRLSVGAPDTRNQLLKKGKFVSHGLHFRANSDQLRPDSNGALRDIAAVLNENRNLRVLIVDHTDDEGDNAQNLELSKRRAETVKLALATEFGVDASRLSTDGRGESQPAAPNTTPAGRANNRRVEFIKQ